MTIMPAIPQLSGSGICTDEDKAVSYTASCLLREHLSEYSQLSNPPTPHPNPPCPLWNSTCFSFVLSGGSCPPTSGPAAFVYPGAETY